MPLAGEKNLNSGTADWMSGHITLTAAPEIYTLGHIYYIFLDPERGIGLIMGNKEKGGRQTR